MDDLNEAYKATMAAVEEIRSLGVGVRVEASLQSEGTAKKYDQPDRLSRDKWVSVTFSPKTDEHKALVHRKAKELGWLGIGFDTGGGFGELDWDLDWSFRVTDVPDGEMEARRDAVEDMLKGCEGPEGP